MRVEDIPFQLQMNICFKIIHDNFYEVYYGLRTVEEVIQHGDINIASNLGDLIPELKEKGYVLYE